MAPILRRSPSSGPLANDQPSFVDLLSRAILPFRNLKTELAVRDAQMISIPSTYTHIIDSPGVVVGIVLGTVCGFILVIWVLALIFSPRGPFPSGDTGTVISSSETSWTFSSYTKSRSRRRRQPEVVEVQESPTASRVSDGRAFAEVYDEEYDSPPHSPRRSHRRSSGYKGVNPREYGGGGRSARRAR
ncbi:hypothetical protein VTO42DRAFT_5807 [Malbranchea cinnamomea]